MMNLLNTNSAFSFNTNDLILIEEENSLNDILNLEEIDPFQPNDIVIEDTVLIIENITAANIIVDNYVSDLSDLLATNQLVIVSSNDEFIHPVLLPDPANKYNPEQSQYPVLSNESIELQQHEQFYKFCDCCNLLFTDEALYKQHTTRPAIVEKPYECKICEKQFTQKSSLWKHTRTHTGEKPFECIHCGKTFSQRANMLRHQIIHEDQKPFKCEQCNRTFRQEVNLNKHNLLHSGEKPFVCDVCLKCFSQRSNLTKHQLIHKGIKPFTCNTCEHSFTQLSNLKRHNCIHTSNDVYFCTYCNKPYTKKISVEKHMKLCKVGNLYKEFNKK